MRPEKLFPIFSDVTRLRGVGPGAKKALARLFYRDEGARPLVRDVAFHLPVGVVDRRNSPSLAQAKDGDIVTWIVTVETHQAPARKRGAKLPYKIICHMKEGFVTLVFFHARPDYLAQTLPAGARRVVSGKFERYDTLAQITHPDIIALPEEFDKIHALEPVYPLTGGLTNRHMGKIVASALATMPELPEWIDTAHLAQQQWKGWKTSLAKAHQLAAPEDISPMSPARQRLAYDELLANQLALALVRARVRRPVAEPLAPGAQLRAKALASLPYRLTAGQEQVLREIDEDLASGNRMLRLLQGDVGSGKTVVALFTALSAIEAGRQAALMVPTELLGRQHHAVISRILEPLGVRALLLTGGMKPVAYAQALAEIADGSAAFVIGTHAVIQDKVAFRDLALAIIDEQHRFGVAQRMTLAGKSPGTHVLVMTATPIPRTLAMTAFGDMDSSVLSEKPAGRQAIATKTVPLSRAEEVLEGIGRATAKGDKVYWICPLVEESDDENVPSDLAAAEARHIEFTHRFGPRVGLVHGRMPAAQRDAVMTGFAGEAYDILVATTVVEVGVDVPDATIIVIEHAERFGLAQLHQLRGRVGRSDKLSACILLYTDRCGEIAKSRLRVIRETNDGFRIAEEDLKLRGSGDILGVRQSGLPDFRFADLSQHYDLLRAAHADAKLILHRDAGLESPRGQALRHLLYLFGYDDNIRFLSAG
jgi:ATP-dependent DNA helicase RecG